MDDVSRYGVVIDGRRGGYGVVFPDLPGCTAMGRTLDEALRHAREAAAEWVQMVKPIPRPRPLEQLRDDADVKQALAEGAVLAVVPVLFESGKPTKANISMDAGTLEAIDAEAAALGLTRSAFITSAALEKIRRGA
jgi:predicted RNase H-like HicB family nuclease